jgi:hypothetical protein
MIEFGTKFPCNERLLEESRRKKFEVYFLGLFSFLKERDTAQQHHDATEHISSSGETLTCISEVRDSKLGRETNYLEVSCNFSLFLM